MRVLLVEDNPIIQLMHNAMLIALDCQVDLASNATEALFMTNQGYDLILLDIELPDFSGIEVAAKLQRQAITKRTRIIALTALKKELIEQECLEVGIEQIINKPINIKDLQALVDPLLQAS